MLGPAWTRFVASPATHRAPRRDALQPSEAHTKISNFLPWSSSSPSTFYPFTRTLQLSESIHRRKYSSRELGEPKNILHHSGFFSSPQILLQPPSGAVSVQIILFWLATSSQSRLNLDRALRAQHVELQQHAGRQWLGRPRVQGELAVAFSSASSPVWN